MVSSSIHIPPVKHWDEHAKSLIRRLLDGTEIVEKVTFHFFLGLAADINEINDYRSNLVAVSIMTEWQRSRMIFLHP